MTRAEERQQAAEQKYPYVGGAKGAVCQACIPVFVEGAEWADRTLLDKASNYLSTLNIEHYRIGEDVYSMELVEDFRKAMAIDNKKKEL